MRSRSGAIAVLMLVVLLAGCGSEGKPVTPVTDRATVQQEIAAALREVPIPPGATIAPVLPDEDGNYQAGYGRVAVEGLAMCAWFEYWMDAVSDGRATDAASAKQVVSQFSTWTTYRTADQSFRDVIDGIVDKADLGDLTAMASFVQANCH